MNETLERELRKEIDELRSKEKGIRILRQDKEAKLHRIILEREGNKSSGRKDLCSK
jgi:hypothetical protein